MIHRWLHRLTGRGPARLVSVGMALGLAAVAEFPARPLAAGGEPQGPSPFRDTCTNRDLEGSFAFFGTGVVLASPVTGLTGPFSRVGRLVSDGAGNLRFSSRATFRGLTFHQDFSGIYTMNRDCTFTAVVTLPFSHPSITPFTLQATFRGVLSEQGREMQDLFVNPPGVVIYGKARKQGISRCTERDLFGSYQLEFTGSTLDLGFPLPFGGNGRLEANGRGRLEGRVSSNVGGFSTQADVLGTYTVEEDCTVQLRYCVFAQDGRSCLHTFAVFGALFDEGRSAYLVVLEPAATTIMGQLKLQ